MDHEDLSDPEVRRSIADEATRRGQQLLLWLALGAVVAAVVLGPVWLALALR